MEGWKEKTIQTYDTSAKDLAEYFKGIGPRVADIERGLELAGANGRVVEIGCGDGRDAAEIVQRADWYEGFDPSDGLLAIAKEKNPGASFVRADALSYAYPSDLDAVFAFASLLHVNREELAEVFARVLPALRTGGIFYISLKERPEYVEEVKRDTYGERMFYYYMPSVVQQIAGEAFETAYENHQRMGDTDWFTLALKKKA